MFTCVPELGRSKRKRERQSLSYLLPFLLILHPYPSGTTYSNTVVSKLQALTHLQEKLHTCLIQDDVHRDPALTRSIYDVLEDIAISEEVHDHSNDLDVEGHW